MGRVTDVELHGLSVLQWPKVVDTEKASGILVGCSIDNQIDDFALMIESVGPDHVLQCRLGAATKRIPPAILSRSTVLDNRSPSPLLAAINSIKSPAQIELEQAQARLQSYGIPPHKVARADDVPILLATMMDHDQQVLPSNDAQIERYEALKRTGMLAAAANVVDGWQRASLKSRGLVDGSILIMLAYCLRHSGTFDRALEVTAPVIRADPRVVVKPGQKGILATVRAAFLLDLYEHKRDHALLEEARRCAGISWDKSPSEQASLVYMRIDSLEINS